MYICDSKLKVRYVETDKMGIVHHSNYYAWFEVGRGDFIKKLGMSYRDMEEKGIMMPLVETYCKYYEGARYEDDVIVKTHIEELSPVKVIFNYDIVRERDHKLLAKGKTTQTFINSSFKIINLKKVYPEIWGDMQRLL